MKTLYWGFNRVLNHSGSTSYGKNHFVLIDRYHRKQNLLIYSKTLLFFGFWTNHFVLIKHLEGYCFIKRNLQFIMINIVKTSIKKIYINKSKLI